MKNPMLSAVAVAAAGTQRRIAAHEEAVITVVLEQMMSKRRIFDIYLNVIERGEAVSGAEAAARHYYRASAASLSPEQAAMVPNPRYYDKHRDARGMVKKTGITWRA